MVRRSSSQSHRPFVRLYAANVDSMELQFARHGTVPGRTFRCCCIAECIGSAPRPGRCHCYDVEQCISPPHMGSHVRTVDFLFGRPSCPRFVCCSADDLRQFQRRRIAVVCFLLFADLTEKDFLKRGRIERGTTSVLKYCYIVRAGPLNRCEMKMSCTVNGRAS